MTEKRDTYKIESFHLGENFHRAACDIFPDDCFGTEDDDGHWFVPYIICLSFACELYLKSLLYDSTSMPRGHYLSDLFNKLDSKIQSEIISHPKFSGDDRFLEKLEKNKNLFIDWRYFFEPKEGLFVELVFLENLALVLHETAEKEVNGQ